MKSIIILISVAFIFQKASCQLYGEKWVVGAIGGTTAINFSGDSVGLDTVPGEMGTIAANACISDENGNLLYYTNGCYINDRTGNLLLNGDTISPCPYTYQQYLDGINVAQIVMFLPMPGDSTHYYLFDFSLDSTDYHPGNLYYNLIDKNGNGGLGAVIKKNVSFFNGGLMRLGGITACKHANGRDYWIIMGESNTNGFYKFLLTPDTILGPFTQYIGPVFSNADDYGCAVFSQDGSRYATSCYEGPVLIMDFDRCTGEFSNPVTVFNENSTDPIENPESGCGSLAFSPNGRFVYVSDVISLNQYDLWSDSIQDSVAVYTADSNEFYFIDLVQLAPNGKIYGSTFNGGLEALHVVNYPDLKGDSCGFVYGGQPTYSLNNMNVPNMINYQLGPLAGSGCDTIPSLCNSATTLLRASVCKGQTYTVGNFTHNQTGFYSDTMQNINGCDSIVSLQLTVDSVDAQVIQTSQDTLILSANGNILWVSCDTTQLITWATTDTFVPAASGEYAAIVTSGMCSDTTACYAAVINSIQILSNSLLRILPNPADKYLYVEMGYQGNYEFQLLNEMGQVVDTKETKQVDIFDTERLASGVYFIKAIDKNNKQIITKKIVIQH